LTAQITKYEAKSHITPNSADRHIVRYDLMGSEHGAWRASVWWARSVCSP